jgi:hypothetical protein
MLKFIRDMGLNSDTMYLATFASILGSIGIWALTNRESEDRAHAERFGIFVGLWAPTFWAMGNAMKDAETQEDEAATS